jgi:acetyl esterase
VLEPTTQKFLDGVAAAGGPPLYTLSPEAARGVLSKVQGGSVALRPADLRDTTFPVGPKESVRVRIVRPKGAREALPVVMYFHGGGWVLGDAATHERLVRELAEGAHAAVVFVDYDRSPEVKFPVANEEAYAATRYVVEHAKALNVDGSRLAVAGDSAGGNMSAAVTLMAKERGGPRISYQVLFYPVTDTAMDTGSYAAFQDGPWLTKPAMKWFANAYWPDEAARASILAAPLKASVEQLRGLPDALVITAENDVLRDEGEAYARKLTQAGVRVTATRYNGTIHDFVMLNPLADTPAARGAIAQANAALKAALHK